jgi:hypothetical protein
MDAGDQLIELASGGLDVAVIHHVRPLTEAVAVTLAAAELGIVCPDDDPLAGREAVNPSELAGRDTILAVSALARDCEQALVEQCRALGFTPRGSYGASGPESFLEALGAIAGQSVVAIAPRTPSLTAASLAWRPLHERPLTVRTSALLDPSHDPAAARNFVAALVIETRA